MSVLAAAMVVIGFWPSFFGPLARGALEQRPVLIFHGAVFSGWFVLLIAQAALVYRGRVDLHRRLGVAAVVYTAFLICVGVAATVDEFSVRMAAGDVRDAHGFLLVPIVDLMFFTSFFGAAIVYRSRPQAHRRLIIIATTILLGPAVARMAFLGGIAALPTPLAIAILLGIVLLPVWFGMAYDLASRRRVHPVYVIGVVVLLASVVRLPLRQSDAWIDFMIRVVGRMT